VANRVDRYWKSYRNTGQVWRFGAILAHWR
jgi:hypothetical protein